MDLKRKINQLFILGYEGEDFKTNYEFVDLLKNNLGGVIFFTQNILEENQFKTQIKEMGEIAKTSLLLSIDEEGGRVERFENINKDFENGKKYLSAKFIAQKGEKTLIEQTKEISEDLKKFGLNMNFSPVLDVNSNPQNPIIGERAYSDNPKDVAKWGLLVNKIYNENGIITVGKHFPGHGDTKKDSHLEMPEVDLPFDEFEKIHIYPFKKAVEDNIPAIMIAHVHYSCFDKEKIPASISKNVLNYLKNDLNYKGLIISDDMEMGGIKEFSKLEAVTTMLKNGVNCFIYRTCTPEIVKLLKDIEKAAKSDSELSKTIDESFDKISSLKKRFLI